MRYRLRHSVPAGKPDLVFPGRRVAVFVDGCFWHGCPRHYVPPRSRRDYWEAKLEGNVLRDIQQTRELEAAGWAVVRVWACQVETSVVQVADQISRTLQSPRQKEQKLEWRVLSVDWLDDAGQEERRTLVALGDSATRRVVERPRSFIEQKAHDGP